MPVSSDKLKVLYDAVSADYDLGTIDDFKTKLSDPVKRKSFFDGVGAEYDLGKDINDFESKLGFKKKDGGEISSPSMESPLPSPSVGIDPVEIQKRYERVGKGRTYLNELIDKKRTELPEFAPMATDFMRSAAQFNETGRKVERTNLVYDFLDKNFDVNTNDNTRDAFISSQYAGTYFSESPDLKYEYDKSDMKSVLTPRQFTGLKSLSFGKQSEYGQAIKKLSDPNVDAAEKEVIKLELDKIGVGIDKDAASAMVSQGVNSDLATQIFSKAKADEPLIEESLRNVDYQNPYSLRTFKNVIKGATERGYLVGERADLVTATAEETGIDVDRLAYLQGELKNSKASKAYEQFSENPSFENFKKAPIGIMLELSLESLAALYTHGASRMAAGAATGAAVGSVLPGAGTAAGASYGTISGMGLASLNLEYSSSILEGLDALGVNTSDPEALRSAFASEETMSKLKRTAYAKSIPVAIFDMLSAGIAGKIVTKPAKTVLGKVAGGVAEMGAQAAAGMAGEAAGQLAAEGRIYAPNAIILEGLGELGPGVIEVAYGSMVESAKRNKPIAKADVVNIVSSGQQETVRQNVDAEVKAGTMSPEQASVVKEEISKTEVSVAKIPDDLSVDAKAQIVELIEKKSELTAKAKTLDDAFKQDVESQIADVDQQIIQITQNDRNATVQSQVEQQAGPAEGGVQERPGVDGGQQEVGQGAGQQGQATVAQPDTGDRVLGGQEEVDLAGELRRELRQDFQPIIDRAGQSLQAANVQFEVVDDAEFTSRAGQSAEGAFMTVGKDGKILLNRQKMEQADPGVIIWHESAHPVMNIVRNTNKPLYDRMVTGLKQVAQRSPELQRAIEFGKQYGTKLREAGRGGAEAIALEDDESIVESIAMIAADDKLMASLPTSIKQTLIDFVNYVAKALGIKARVTNTASADFRRTAQQIATALKEGRDITEIVGAENVGEIDNRLSEGITDIDGNQVDPAAAQFKVSGFKALINGIEFKYLKDSDRYNQLKADGFITEDKKISDFSNVPAILHVPDHAFTGEMIKDGEVIVDGKGGVFYPLRFHDLGYFWASTKTAATGMAAKLNAMRAQSPDGKMRLVLLSAPEDKLMSSTAASAGMLDVLLSKAFDRRAKITKDQVFEAYRIGVQKLKQEALTKGQKGVKFSGKVEDFVKTLPTVAKSATVDAFKSKLRSWFAPDVSNFDQRKKLNSFVLDSIAEIVSDKDAAAQILEFLAESSGQKIKSTGGRLSKANLVSGFSKLFSEPMLKGVATTGDAYAVIELDADVEAVSSNEHESYPFALKSVDSNKKPVVHVLQDRTNWSEFTVDPETGSVVTEDRQDNILPPSAGISNIVTLRPQAASQLSIGGRQGTVEDNARIQFSAGPRAESRVEFKLVAFVLRKKAEGHTDQQIASAIRSVMPGMTQQQVDNLVSNPEDFLFRAYPGISPMQFQNLLRRAQVKNIYRGNMPQNIAERFLSSMVPNEVLEKYYMQVKTKAQVRKDAINQFLTKNFDPAKGLPKWVMLLKEYSSGAKNLEIARAKSTLDRLAKTAREIGFTDWKTFSDALRNLNEEEAIMSGSAELTLFDPATGMAMVPSSGERLQRPLTLLRLPMEIQPYVREMRNQIDGLTKKLITGGFVTPEQAVTLEMNLGEYTNRAYELYTKKGFQPKKEAFDAAVRFLADQEYRRLLTEYINNLSVAVRGQIGVMTGAGPIVAESGTGIPYAKLAEEAAQYAERRANDIINKKETPYFGGSGPTSRGLGILKQRQTIPQPIRALMGEYTDPGVVFMMTVAKQAELAATSDFLRQLRDQGLGTLFFEKNDQNRPATHSVPLASDTSATMEPLNGLYTTPEIAEAFEDAVNTRNAVVQLWMKIVGANRWFKTVGSIRTQFVNFESNLGFAVLNGLVFTKEGRPFNASFRRPLGKGLQEAGKYVKGQYGPKEMTEITEKLIKLGLVGQSIDINAIRQAFREDDMFEMALDVALTSEGVFKKKSISRIKPQAPFNKAYRMGDDFWKVYGYITERETVANGRYETSYDQLTDEQKEAVDKEAADRVKDTWPTYDRMFEAVRKLSQNVPILGNFTAFQAESIRVLMNSIRLMKKDLADPQMRQAGIRRALGISTYLGLRTGITTMTAMAMGYGVSGVLGLLLNDDDEEDKKWAIKEVSPIFMRTGDLLIKQDKDKPHIYTVIDLLSIDAIGITQRSMNALTEGNENMDAGVGAAVAELFGGFLEREMTFKAAEDLVRNRNSSNGLKIYNEEDTPGEAVGKITKSLYKSLKPSSVGLVERALTNENKAFEAAAFVGFRPYEIDLHQSFNISLTRMRNSIDEISAEYFKIKFDPKISEEDKEQARLRAGEKKAEVIKKYNRLYTTLIKLGASQEVLEEMVDEKKAVKPTGMDKKTKAGILEGGVDPTTLY